MSISRRNLLIGISAITTQSVLAVSTSTIPVIPAQQNTRKNLYGVEIYTLDTLQKSGHILSTDEAQKVVSSWQGRKDFGQFFSAHNHAEEVKDKIAGAVDMSTVTHVVSNLRVDSGKLIVDIELLSTEAGKRLEWLFHYKLASFKPYGFVNIDNDGNMTNYRLARIDAVESDNPHCVTKAQTIQEDRSSSLIPLNSKYQTLYDKFVNEVVNSNYRRL